MDDRTLLIQDKYHGQAPQDALARDMERLQSGEPLAYVIGWVPFLGLHIALDSKPLIPRPETEWWTEELQKRIQTYTPKRTDGTPLAFLDLCAGSGAIGCALIHTFPNAQVSFGEQEERHAALIQKNVIANALSTQNTSVRIGDLFAPFVGMRFDIIATNPPYVPAARHLPKSVQQFEPAESLYAGTDGLTVVRRIAQKAPQFIYQGGELWLECDASHAAEALRLVREHAKGAEMHTDPYGRPRLIVGYY